MIDQTNTRTLNPNVELGSLRSGYRYPNQFFDLSQQYMPPTIRELFRWCTFYFYNSPLIGSAVKKISRYPITDIILEDKLESTKDTWEKILVNGLKIKDRMMEVNLDAHTYGNCFVSLHFPFTRFLTCTNCKKTEPIRNWDWDFKSGPYSFYVKCTCGKNTQAKVKDVPYKDRNGIKILRWNPQNISLKHNEFTGRYIYMYSVPHKIRKAIESGDKDILEDLPLIVIDAVRKKKLIRINPNNIFHIKNPTLAEQDQGWGKPTIIHVLKDMFYFYTLRRAQEAVAMEHIVPLDIIFPMPNAQQDPYIHTDLGSWRSEIERIIKKHRRDPNFKAVIPVPVGTSRVGGDGKALLLSPELNYITQTVVGGMGIPQEFLFGGLNYTGSSISLRTLENDFVQNRSQLLDLIHWIKDKIRVYLNVPDIKGVRFADFRMADDVQRNQQLIGLNAQGKVSNTTLLTELGYDAEEETKKIIEELYIQNHIQDTLSKGSSKSQGEASIIQFNYQQKIQELAEKARENAEKRLKMERANISVSDNLNSPTPDGGMMMQGAPQGAMPPNGGQMPPQGGGMAPQGGDLPPPAPGMPLGGGPSTSVDEQIHSRVESWSAKLMQMDPNSARMTIADLKSKMPNLGAAVEESYNAKSRAASAPDTAIDAGQKGQGGQGPDHGGILDKAMKPMPEQRAPTRGSVTGAG